MIWVNDGIAVMSATASSPRATASARAGVEADFSAIVEGRCPRHSVELERLQHCGWCHLCGHGWAARTSTAYDSWCEPGEHIVATHYFRDPRGPRPPEPPGRLP